MSHAWEGNVVGGVDVPRFVLCDGDQFVTNGEFEADTTGWSDAPGAGPGDSASLLRVGDPLSPFGDYVLRLTAAGDGDPNEYSYTEVETDASMAQKTFVVTFWARADQIGATARCEAYSWVPQVTNIFLIEDLERNKYKQYAFVFTWYWGMHRTAFKLKFFARNGSGESGYLYIDRVKCYEVTNDITTMPQPNYDEYRYMRQVQAKTVMADGRIKTYVLGWRFGASLDYQFLTAAEEILRAQISEADLMVFWPHVDCPFCVTARYSSDRYLRQYFQGRYLGHQGKIVLEGVDVFGKKTERIVGVAIS